MKTATVRELRNNYAGLLELVKAGQEILITQRGEAVARLVPETAATPRAVDWSTSEAATRDRSGERILTAEESSQLLREASGKW
jgi:prevent-host-death family protein